MLMSVETSQSEEEGGGIVVFWQGVHWESNAIWKAGDSVGPVIVGGGTIRELESFSGGGEGRGSKLVLHVGPNFTLDV